MTKPVGMAQWLCRGHLHAPGTLPSTARQLVTLGSKAWAHLCVLEIGTISGFLLTFSDSPGAQLDLGPVYAPSLHRPGLLEAAWTLRHTSPGLSSGRGEKPLHASVSPSSNWVWHSPPCRRTHGVECGKMVEKYKHSS